MSYYLKYGDWGLGPIQIFTKNNFYKLKTNLFYLIQNKNG